jgi:hypothetical protein
LWGKDEKGHATPRLPQTVPQVIDELAYLRGSGCLQSLVQSPVRERIDEAISARGDPLCLDELLPDLVEAAIGVTGRGLSDRKDLQPHADADSLQHVLFGDGRYDRAAMCLGRHQPIALQKPDGVADRHHA